MRAYKALAGLLLMLIVAAWLRVPFVTAGLPFLYLLDEAHHFHRLVGAGLAAGLAFSTKYNALPIVALPLIVCLISGRRSAGATLLALSMAVVGFLLGTPYAVLDLPRFLNDMAFETWHYGTAGHGAAPASPGCGRRGST